MTIRGRLLLLALAIILPAVCGAVWGLISIYQHQRWSASENLKEITRAVAAVVDRELRLKVATLETLAKSPALLANDIPAFHAYARAVAGGHERTVVLFDLQGRQQINTRLPLGSPLPASRAFSALHDPAKPERTLLSDLYFAPVGQRYSYALRVPVYRDGKLAAYLSMGSFAHDLQKSMEDQRLRPGWNSAVLDRQGMVVARRLEPEKYVGKTVSERLRVQIAQDPEGLFEGVRLDGVQTLTSYAPIGDTGWTLVISMPKAVLEQQILSALAVTGAITLLMLVLAIALAAYVAHTIAQPIRRLVDLAGAIGHGGDVPQPPLALKETAIVGAELVRAHERIRTANDTLERRVQEAIAETRRAESALLQNQKLEALGKLTGGIAHDFNNLLQTIGTALEIGARLSQAEPLKTAMETGKRAVQKATKLTRQLTTFGRGSVSAPAVIDLNTHFAELKYLLEGALRESVKLTIDVPPETWPVRVDPTQLELALLNLVLNARDAMPRGGNVDIVARNLQLAATEALDLPAGDYVRITVQDTGVGIAPDVLPRVFEPFFTTKEVGKGSGLGLAQVYGFSRMAGGTATIDSSPEQGTRVVLLLPRSLRVVGDAAAPAAPPPREVGKQGCHVLLVEDDQLVADVVVPALAAAGFRVTTARDGEMALRLLREQAVDVVFSDVVMPGRLDGFELGERIRAQHPDVPVVLATGYSDAMTASSPFRILLKPYSIDEAIVALRQAAAGKLAA